MFTWICPQCGREVPPAYTDCPDCAKATPPADAAQAPPPTAAQPATPVYQAPPPPYQAPPSYQAPPQPAAPPQYAAAPPQYAAAPPQYLAPEPRRGLPTWALTVLFALAFLGLGSGIYWLVGASHGATAKPTTTVESPAAKPGAK